MWGVSFLSVRVRHISQPTSIQRIAGRDSCASSVFVTTAAEAVTCAGTADTLSAMTADCAKEAVSDGSETDISVTSMLLARASSTAGTDGTELGSGLMPLLLLLTAVPVVWLILVIIGALLLELDDACGGRALASAELSRPLLPVIPKDGLAAIAIAALEDDVLVLYAAAGCCPGYRPIDTPAGGAIGFGLKAPGGT